MFEDPKVPLPRLLFLTLALASALCSRARPEPLIASNVAAPTSAAGPSQTIERNPERLISALSGGTKLRLHEVGEALIVSGQEVPTIDRRIQRAEVSSHSLCRVAMPQVRG